MMIRNCIKYTIAAVLLVLLCMLFVTVSAQAKPKEAAVSATQEMGEEVGSKSTASAPKEEETMLFRFPFLDFVLRFLVRGSLVFGGAVLLGIGIFILKVPEKKHPVPPLTKSKQTKE